MSMEGIHKFAGVMSIMQQARHELLEMGTKAIGTPAGNQDIRLAQLLDDAKDSVKEEFCRATIEEIDVNSNNGSRRPSGQKQGRKGRRHHRAART